MKIQTKQDTPVAASGKSSSVPTPKTLAKPASPLAVSGKSGSVFSLKTQTKADTPTDKGISIHEPKGREINTTVLSGIIILVSVYFLCVSTLILMKSSHVKEMLDAFNMLLGSQIPSHVSSGLTILFHILIPVTILILARNASLMAERTEEYKKTGSTIIYWGSWVVVTTLQWLDAKFIERLASMQPLSLLVLVLLVAGLFLGAKSIQLFQLSLSTLAKAKCKRNIPLANIWWIVFCCIFIANFFLAQQYSPIDAIKIVVWQLAIYYATTIALFVYVIYVSSGQYSYQPPTEEGEKQPAQADEDTPGNG